MNIMQATRKIDKLEKIAEQVFTGELEVAEFLNQYLNLYPLAAGKQYPALVQVIIHYIADKDIRANDQDYEAEMRTKILEMVRSNS